MVQKSRQNKRRKARTSTPVHVQSKEDESKFYPVGTKIRKFFKGFGWYNGEIVGYRRLFIYTILFDDGDVEELTDFEMNKSLRESIPWKVEPPTDDEETKPSFSIGTKVKKFFSGHGWFDGHVTGYRWVLMYNIIYEDGDAEEWASEYVEKGVSDERKWSKRNNKSSPRQIARDASLAQQLDPWRSPSKSKRQAKELSDGNGEEEIPDAFEEANDEMSEIETDEWYDSKEEVNADNNSIENFAGPNHSLKQEAPAETNLGKRKQLVDQISSKLRIGVRSPG